MPSLTSGGTVRRSSARSRSTAARVERQSRPEAPLGASCLGKGAVVLVDPALPDGEVDATPGSSAPGGSDMRHPDRLMSRHPLAKPDSPPTTHAGCMWPRLVDGEGKVAWVAPVGLRSREASASKPSVPSTSFYLSQELEK